MYVYNDDFDHLWKAENYFQLTKLMFPEYRSMSNGLNDDVTIR